MLAEFSVKNIYSFAEEATLSYRHPANRAKTFKQNTIYEYQDEGKKCILNGAIILGSNASGKSNLIRAIKHFSSYIKTSFRYEEQADIIGGWEPFKFSESSNNITEFKIEVIITKNIYQNLDDDYLLKYCFNFNNENGNIEYEKFSYNKIMKSKLSEEKILVLRKKDEVVDNTRSFNQLISKIEKENIDQKLIVSMLFYDINKTFFNEEVSKFEYALLEAFVNYTTMKMKFADETIKKSYVKKINDDKQYRKYILNSLSDFDFGIKDFEIKDITDELIARFSQEDNVSSVFKEIIEDLKRERNYIASAIHEIDGKKTSIDIESESHGTKKFLMESVSIYETINNNGLYMCDEFESAFHQKIQIGIINNFINSKGTCQFLIITHNPYLLKSDLFSKEQIMFVEKDYESESSEIYSLSDFDITYNNHNWTNLYLEGRFGAVPEVIF